MEVIFHEKQDGSLCAQHCLNSLLQGPYFTAVDLGQLAHRLDEEERQRMAESGVDTEEYRQFLQQPSTNMDDSGYFSVQVISSALQVWGLELVPYFCDDERAKRARERPSDMKAFICNYKDHWFTIRKLGNQWFNLNSLLKKPELISDTYLSLFLAQLKNDGYSIFIVFGEFPDCSADAFLKNNPIGVTQRTPFRATVSNESDSDIQTALRLSLQECLGSGSTQVELSTPEVEDSDLQEALRLSLQASSSNNSPEEEDEESLLRKAISMSLQC